MTLKVGTSSGIYYAAREAELHNTLRKVGYTLTRGTAAMEIAFDVAHEVTFTEGRQIRHLAKKQGITLNAHGDLAVPMCIPERGEWRDAQDRIKKSLRSAVFIGAKYIDFHACLNVWLELITYAGRKLSAAFVDGEGRFISHVLKDCEKTREWFTRHKYEEYLHEMFSTDERAKIGTAINLEVDRSFKERISEELSTIDAPKEAIEQITFRVLQTQTTPPGLPPALERQVSSIIESVRQERRDREYVIQRDIYQNAVREKLKKGKKWHREELRQVLGLVDGYHIIAHYLFYNQDPIWKAMADEYKDVLKKYDYNTSNFDWLDEAWNKAETDNDREYKEFFYAAVGAKFMEGHMKSAFTWIKNEFIKHEIPRWTKDPAEQEELRKIAKNLIIGIENPDAREPQHSGLYYLFRPKQIYAAVKTIRKTLNTDKLMMIVDHEQIATQGIDSLVESRRDILSKPDFGKLTISIHSNHPNPLHAHHPIELGDVVLYELLYNLRVTGFGQDQIGFMIFERGGGQDPFAHSVDALRLMKKYLETEPPTPVDKLPLEFFGMKGLTGGDVQRQLAIVKDKAWEPLKDLLEIPEEEWTMLSQTAIKKGKRPEVWKRGEFR